MFCYKDLVRFFAITLCFALCWQGAITLFHIPHYLLPDPISVTQELTSQWALLFLHAKVTLWEIILGLVLGFLFGLSSALLLASSTTLSAFLLPIFIASQAIPVFAIAPLLVLWFGYGIASKIAMTILIIYFPVTAACYDGLRNTPKQWLEQAQSFGISSWQQLFRVRLPLPCRSRFRLTHRRYRCTDWSDCGGMGRLIARLGLFNVTSQCTRSN